MVEKFHEEAFRLRNLTECIEQRSLDAADAAPAWGPRRCDGDLVPAEAIVGAIPPRVPLACESKKDG
jgi:hypothetical protein